MPCYCSTPDSYDQIEIERRCKYRMYFDARELMSDANLDKCDQFPIGDINTDLCKICSVLNKEQMEKVSAYYFEINEIKWLHKTLYDWYVQHCKDDEKFNSPEI